MIPEELFVYKPFTEYQMDESEMRSSIYKIYTTINVTCGACIADIALWNEFNQQLKQYDIPIIIICTSSDEFILFEYMCVDNPDHADPPNSVLNHTEI